MPGVVTLVFDDGYQHIFTEIAPELTRRNITGVFAVPLDTKVMEKNLQLPMTPYSQWLSLQKNGHEIAAHSVHHQNLTQVPTDDRETELAEPAKVLDATTIVYPGGAINEEVLKAAKKYYRAGRTVKRGFESLKPHDPLALHTFDYTRRNFSLWKANARVLYAWLTNKWLIETYHLIGDYEQEHTVTPADFWHHVDFIQRLGIPVRTIKTQLSL